jgi:hypothetical protein
MSHVLVALVALFLPAWHADQDDAEQQAREALEAFKKAGGDGSDERKVSAALSALVSGPQHALIRDKLIALLKHRSRPVVAVASQGLGRYPESTEARDALVELLRKEAKGAKMSAQGMEEKSEIAGGILNILPSFKPSDAMEQAIVEALKSQSIEVSSGAANTCGQMKLLGAVDGLVEMMTKAEKSKANPVDTTGMGGAAAKLTAAQIKQDVDYRRKQQHLSSAGRALNQILGVEKQNSAEYAQFWKENAEKIKAQKK